MRWVRSNQQFKNAPASERGSVLQNVTTASVHFMQQANLYFKGMLFV